MMAQAVFDRLLVQSAYTGVGACPLPTLPFICCTPFPSHFGP